MEHSTIYPAPPITAETFAPIFANFTVKRNAVATTESAYNEAVAAKDQALAVMVTAMKKDLRYAEDTVDGDDAKLKLLGWGARKEPRR